MSDLKPCANCAGEATRQAPNMHRKTCIACKECGMSTGWGTVEEVTATWNRRAQPANEPLTLEQLRGMVGEWVWVEHMDSPASQAAPGEWLKLKTCEPTRLDPYIRFEGKGLCALYSGQSWLAYRRKPERSEG